MKRIALLCFILYSSPAWACDHFTRLYATAATVDFCLWEPDGTDFMTSATITAGEVKLAKDEGAEANCSTGSGACVTDEGSCYSLALTSTEMTAARVYVTVIDTATKTFLDKCLIIETYGNSSAQHGVPSTNLTQIDGQATSGNNATLNLKQLNIVNSAGSAIVASSTGSNGSGINASGNGTGSGIKGTGGATGKGVETIGGSTSGAAISATNTTGDVITATAVAGNGNALTLAGQGSGSALLATGGATGRGIWGKGGSTSGAGIRGEGMGGNSAGIYGVGIGGSPGMDLIGGSTNGSGLVASGQGTGSGFVGVGGATGNGSKFIGGSTSGDGIDTSVTSGVGIDATLSALTATYGEPTACLTWPATIPDMLRFLSTLARNKLTQTATSFTLRNDGDSATICASTTSKTLTTFTRGELN